MKFALRILKSVAVLILLLLVFFLFLYHPRHAHNSVILKRYTSNATTPYSARPIDMDCIDVIKKYNISMNNFVLGLSYWEQLTMATNSLCCLTAFSRHWHARTVEPFTRNAEMWGLPSTSHYPIFRGMPPIYKAGPAKPLNSLFNMTLFNSHMLCSQHDIPPLADFEEFMLNANRGIRLLHFNFETHGETLTAKDFSEKNHINCFKYIEFRKFSDKLLHYLNREANQRQLPSFTVDAACCVNHRHVTTPEEIANHCGFKDLNSFTIIITTWRGYSHVPTKKFRLVVPVKSPVLRIPNASRTAYPLNNDVLSNVTAQFMKISGGKDFIAVHFRTAKLGVLDYTSWEKLSMKCFKLAWSLISDLQKQYIDIPIKYFVDYGTFGSHSNEIYHGKRVSRVPFGQKRITPIHYVPSQFGGLADQGFVSLVEQSAIAKAKVLILVGGGSFQDEILARFKQERRGDSAFKICSSQDKLVVTQVV